MPSVEIARAETERGELVLRERRPDGDDPDNGPTAIELRANGSSLTDTVEVGSEQAVAAAALALVDEPRAVLVGGLGLGFTIHAVLGDTRVESCTVVEVEQALVDWMRDGTVPHGPGMLADERASVVVADAAVAVAEAREASYDLVLLDSGTTPHDSSFLASVRRVLRPGGVVVVRSASEAPTLATALGEAYGHAEALPHDVRLQDRDERYWLHVARVPPA